MSYPDPGSRDPLDCHIRTIGCNSGLTALHLASSRGHLDIVRLLLTEGADMTIGSNSGMTALHYACSNRRLDIIRLLLTEGADMTIADKYGRTPLLWATFDRSIANCLRKWPCAMAIIALQELALYYQLDASTIIDLWQYLGDANQ